MPDLHGWEGVIYGGGLVAILGLVVAFWIRWEDQHKPHPPAKQPPL